MGEFKLKSKSKASNTPWVCNERLLGVWLKDLKLDEEVKTSRV